MKAIKVTQELKDNNPELFQGKEVGKIYRMQTPKQFVREQTFEVEGKQETALFRVLAYDKQTELIKQDGFKDLINPTFDNKTHKTGDIIEKNDGYTLEVLPLTDEELDALIPAQIPKLWFKNYLLDNHNIKNSDVDAMIAQIPDDIQKEKIKLLWYEAEFFERSNSNLYAFAPQMGLTKTDITNIFKAYGNA